MLVPHRCKLSLFVGQRCLAIPPNVQIQDCFAPFLFVCRQTNNTNTKMKNAGFILLVMAILSLLGALFSYGRDYDTAGGRFMGALILGGIGILLLYLNNKKENDEYEDYEYESDENQVSAPQESYWQRYKRNYPTKANAIETITERNMVMQGDKDIEELISSIERWAKNLGCDIQDIKNRFMITYKSTFGDKDTKDILEHIKNEKLTEEANRFHISSQNTCSHFMIKWLTEDLKQHSKHAEGNKISYRNKMSARDLILRENAKLDFVQNPESGKIFFVCGSKRGYVSPDAAKNVETAQLDDFNYAEVSIDGNDYVPCLMVSKPTGKVIRSFEINSYDDELP